jgi:hypothetical protein
VKLTFFSALRSSLDGLLSDCVSVEVSLLAARRRYGFWTACLRDHDRLLALGGASVQYLISRRGKKHW